MLSYLASYVVYSKMSFGIVDPSKRCPSQSWNQAVSVWKVFIETHVHVCALRKDSLVIVHTVPTEAISTATLPSRYNHTRVQNYMDLL
jgi:hypothetical protein